MRICENEIFFLYFFWCCCCRLPSSPMCGTVHSHSMRSSNDLVERQSYQVCDKIVESERDRHICMVRKSAKERETVREGNFHKWYSSMSIKYVRRLIEFVGNAQAQAQAQAINVWFEIESKRSPREKKYLKLSCATSTYAENKRTQEAKLILSFSMRANFGEQKCRHFFSFLLVDSPTIPCVFTRIKR